MPRRYAHAATDVFTDRPFGGNPLAAEFVYSETTFVLAPADPAHTARVRIFTPRAEMPFAAHPNVGTAYVLAQQILARRHAMPTRFLFE
jgi:trans-2,3-dihydro-3-hydroxyanthranilate isomerase